MRYQELNNLGTFADMDALWSKHPNGGIEGDYATVAGERRYWNKYASQWLLQGEDAHEEDTTDPYPLDVHHGDVHINRNLSVGGTIRAGVIRQPNVGLFETAEALRRAYPIPEVGMWAAVGDSVPAEIWRCDVAGQWRNTGGTGGVDQLDVDTINAVKGMVQAMNHHTSCYGGLYKMGEVLLSRNHVVPGKTYTVTFRKPNGVTRDSANILLYGEGDRYLGNIEAEFGGSQTKSVDVVIPLDMEYMKAGAYAPLIDVVIAMKGADNRTLLERANHIDGASIVDGTVTPDKTSFIKVVSDNLLNKADVLEGKLINSSNGALVNIQGIFTANYIPVKPSTDYWWLGTQTAYGYAFYDANKQLLTYGSKGTENDQNKPGHATSPEGAAYLRVSFPNGQIDTAQVNEGSWKSHDEYRFGIDDNLLPGDTLPIDGARIINNTVTPDKTTFFVTNRSSINLYNPSAATNGKYIVATTGALADASTLCVSDYIPVKPGTEYFYYGRQRSYGYAFYDADKTRIAFGAKGTENDKNIGSKVAPAGAAYMRVTFLIADNGTNEVNEGIPYLSKIPAQLDTIMGQQGSFASAASLAADGELALGTFPVYISKQLCMVFGCKFSTFTSATLGQRNGYVTVDSQNVYVYGNLSTGGFGLRQTVAHNLTISNYIRLMLFVEGTKVTDTTMNASLVVSTATGYTVIKLNSWYYTHGGEVYASVGQASTDASIGATCIDFRSPVWAFGDSYFGLSPARWPYVMRELGYFNYYFEGLGGGTSYDMYLEMERATKFGTPRYLLWCLGMNDQDPDNTTPSANWLAVFGYIKDYCSENGVQLILATIPNTPTRRNYAKNEVVKASGYRYIDFAKAVGAENAGSSWYTGMLHTDNVHPTELGAQALATQVLIDFPELMEICKTPAVGGGGGDPVDAYTKAEADARFVQPTYVDDKVNAAQGQMVFRDAYSQNIFTSDDVPAGNTISLKYVPLASGSANVIVYDTSGAVLKRFELSSVVAGQEYAFDDYVLPDTYARVYVTNYQHLDVYVTVVGWSNKALFEALKNIGGDEIYVGTTEPTDPNIKLWLNPNENFVTIEQTTGDSEVAVMSQKAVTDALASAGGGDWELIDEATLAEDVSIIFKQFDKPYDEVLVFLLNARSTAGSSLQFFASLNTTAPEITGIHAVSSSSSINASTYSYLTLHLVRHNIGIVEGLLTSRVSTGAASIASNVAPFTYSNHIFERLSSIGLHLVSANNNKWLNGTMYKIYAK